MNLLLVAIGLLLFSCSHQGAKVELPIPFPAAKPTAHVPSVGQTQPSRAPKIGEHFVVETDAVSNITSDPTVIFIDLESDLAGLDKLKASGRWVGAYNDVGTAEDWRLDYNELKGMTLSKLDGHEKWLNVNDPKVLVVMKKRVDRVKALGLAGFYEDDADVMNFEKSISKSQNEAYLKAINDYAHSLGLIVFQNNGLEMIPDMIGLVDGYLNEECQSYGECDKYAQVVGKYPIYEIEYSSKYCKPVAGHTVMLASGLGSKSFKQWCTK
jgi:endo-alpha-1,4-polygalactosaminidase (GH114 family)